MSIRNIAYLAALLVAIPCVAHAQQPAAYGDWALQGAGASRAILSLRDTNPQLLERDAGGVHRWPVRMSATPRGTLVVVARGAVMDSLTVIPRGRRTLFVQGRAADAHARPRIFARLMPAALQRYETELRQAPGRTR